MKLHRNFTPQMKFLLSRIPDIFSSISWLFSQRKTPDRQKNVCTFPWDNARIIIRPSAIKVGAARVRTEGADAENEKCNSLFMRNGHDATGIAVAERSRDRSFYFSLAPSRSHTWGEREAISSHRLLLGIIRAMVCSRSYAHYGKCTRRDKKRFPLFSDIFRAFSLWELFQGELNKRWLVPEIIFEIIETYIIGILFQNLSFGFYNISKVFS